MTTDLPKHIWILPFDGEQHCWCDHPDPSGQGHEDEAVEYIRADHNKAVEAENQRLRAVLEAARFSLDFMAAGDDDAAQMAKVALRSMDRAALRSTEADHDD